MCLSLHRRHQRLGNEIQLHSKQTLIVETLTSLYSNSGVVHVTTNMRKDFSLQSELADCFTVCPRLFRGDRGGQFDIFDTEGIESLGDSNFGLGIEECISKLFTLYRVRVIVFRSCGRVDNGETVPRNVLSMMLKLETLERKSDARGAYGLRFSFNPGVPEGLGTVPRFPLFAGPLVKGTGTISAVGSESAVSWGHILLRSFYMTRREVVVVVRRRICL
jgi:hypothetical protein